MTPDEAVPALLAVKGATNEVEADFATLALWNHDRGDPKLKADVIAALLKPSRYLIPAVGNLGTNAASLEPEIRKLAKDGDTNIQREARIALRKVRRGIENKK